MSEETKSADWTSAWGIVVAVFMSVVLGFAYVIALLFSIQVSLHISRILRVVLHVACLAPQLMPYFTILSLGFCDCVLEAIPGLF